MPEPIVMKLGMYNMPPEPICMVHFINPYHEDEVEVEVEFKL
jgi:hypothetical protein